MVLGIVVVIIVGGLLVNYFKSVNKTGSTSSTNTEIATTPGVTPKPAVSDLPTTYTVQASDSLWVIAEDVYKSGYNWVDVYAANKATIGPNPNRLLVGTKLTLPKVEIRKLTAVETSPVSYTVVKGDNLSTIAFRLCGNAYLWSDIAKANNVANANVIEIGQKFQVSCN